MSTLSALPRFALARLLFLLLLLPAACDRGTPPLSSPSSAFPSALPAASPVPTTTPYPTATPTPPFPPLPSLLTGTVTLSPENTDRYQLEPGALPHPHGLAIVAGTAYLIDAGELVAIPLQGEAAAARFYPGEGRVGEFQIGELIALTTDGNRLFLLDKRGDVYGYDPASGQWSLERPIDQRRVSPNPVFPALAAFDGRIYLLDTGYRQIWRHPYGDGVRESYLPEEGVPDLARGIGLGVDGDVYVLLREGQDGPAGLLRFLGASAAPDPAFAATLERPTFLYLAPNGGDVILVIDRDGHRLQALERSSARPLAVLAFADESVEMRGAFLWEGRLYLSTPGALYVYPGYGETYSIRGAEGPLPEERPDDLRRLSALGPFIPPIAGLKYLPERDSLLPGSPRVYRFGIHQGLDLYGGTAGVEIPYGTPVLAVAAGRVIRADHGYQEMTLDEWEALVAECVRLHRTPPEILDRLRGRQVWIDHGDGLVTRYVHLAGIPDEVISGTLVQQGQVIGYAGNSGTSEGAEGSQRGTHLHFEVVVDGSYLGKWLSLWEVRRLLEQLFFPTGSP